MLNWNRKNYSMKMREISRAVDKKLLDKNELIGKSYLCAIFMVCMAILYPGLKIGICSGKGQQARNVIIQKIQGELIKNQNIAREISGRIKTSADDCSVMFKNGSEIRAITLGFGQSGDNARSKLKLASPYRNIR